MGPDHQTNRFSVLAAALMVAFIVGTCGAQTTLTRETASALLHEQSSSLLSGGGSATLASLIVITSYVEHDDDVLAGRSRLDTSRFSKGQRLEVKFYERLVDLGLYHDGSVTNGANGLTIVYRWAMPCKEAGLTYLQCTLGRRVFGKVTGVRQEGSSATAIMEIRLEPTELYTQLRAALDDVLKEEGLEGLPYPDTQCGKARALCSLANYGNRFDRVKEEKFFFSRYDDGWRYEGRAGLF